jgi:hypothetical protein
MSSDNETEMITPRATPKTTEATNRVSTIIASHGPRQRSALEGPHRFVELSLRSEGAVDSTKGKGDQVAGEPLW